jgi:hypothetical protein
MCACVDLLLVAFQELPNDAGYSELHILGQNNDLQSTPKKFAWLVGR